MSQNTIPEIGIQQVDAILEYLPIFERKNFQPGQWVEREGRFPYFAFSPEVERFIHALYQQSIIFPFDWRSWSDEAKLYQSDPDALEASDLLTLRKLLTAHVRADRFVEGHLAGLLQSGYVTVILRRLKRIRDAIAESDSQHHMRPSPGS